MVVSGCELHNILRSSLCSILSEMALLLSSFRANMCDTERENTPNENGGFTMNEKTARQIAEMKNQTIGVEVEMNNITRQKAAKVAADFFGTGRYENTAGRNGYSTWSAWDAQGREWKFPEGRFHRRAGRAEMRTGHPDPDLRGHRNPAGALQTAQTRRSEKRRLQRMRSSHPHWSAGPHTAEPSEPRQHYGKPRKPDRRSPEA